MGQRRHLVPDNETSATLLLHQAANTAAARGPWAAGRHAVVVETTPLDESGNVNGGDVETRALTRRGPT
eukprot:7928276-Lingulodinium_polyedra.AAC.1